MSNDPIYFSRFRGTLGENLVMYTRPARARSAGVEGVVERADLPDLLRAVCTALGCQDPTAQVVALSTELAKLREHKERPCKVDLTSVSDMKRAATLYTHDLALPTSTAGELSLAWCVEVLVAMVEDLEEQVECLRAWHRDPVGGEGRPLP